MKSVVLNSVNFRVGTYSIGYLQDGLASISAIFGFINTAGVIVPVLIDLTALDPQNSSCDCSYRQRSSIDVHPYRTFISYRPETRGIPQKITLRDPAG
jgi:hypothetical protein